MYLIHSQNDECQQIWASNEEHEVGSVWKFHVFGLEDDGDLTECPTIETACKLIGANPKPIIDACPAFANAA